MAWNHLWSYDICSYDYNEFLPHYFLSNPGRLRYHTQIMSLAANAIDNGVGPAGKPRLEIFVPCGFAHGSYGTCPVCGQVGAYPDVPFVNGCITCLDYQGNVLWRHSDPRIFVQSKIEIADFNDDGVLEIFVNCYHGFMLLNAQTGQVIWDETRIPRTDKFSVFVRDPRKYKDGFINPDYNKVFLYQSMGAHAIVKRNSSGQIVAQGQYSGGPCFAGCSAADMTGDGVPNIVEHTYDASGGCNYCCYDLDLNVVWNDSSSSGGGSAPVLIDVNGNGWLDIVKTISASQTSIQYAVIDGQASYNAGTRVYMKGPTYTNLAGHNAPAVSILNGGGHILAFTDWANSGHGGCWDITSWQRKTEWDGLIKTDHAATIANVWSPDSELNVLATDYNPKIYGANANLLHSNYINFRAPTLVADIDGDGLNEIVGIGNNILPAPGNPFGGTDVWSYAWVTAWDTDSVSLNPYQGVYSQLYSPRRLSSEFPMPRPLWYPIGNIDDIKNFSINVV